MIRTDRPTWPAHFALSLCTAAVLSGVLLILFASSLDTFGFSGKQPSSVAQRTLAITWAVTLAVAAAMLEAGVAWSVLSSWPGAKWWGVIWSIPLAGTIFLGFLTSTTFSPLSIAGSLAIWVLAWGLAVYNRKGTRSVVVAAAVATWLLLLAGLFAGLRKPDTRSDRSGQAASALLFLSR